MSQPFIPKGIDQSELDDVSKTYIVILKSDDNGLDSESVLDKHWKWVDERNNNGLDSGSEWDDVEKYEGKCLPADRTTLAKLSEAAIKDLNERPEVVKVVQDRFGMLDVDDDPPANITSSPNAPWNLQRLSSTADFDKEANPKVLTYTYRRPEVAGLADKPVHVYILDSGITADHEEFQGRQVVQKNFSADQKNHHDIVGHGTHVAGTLAGNSYGVARDLGVRITAIKVATGSDTPALRLSAVNRGLELVLKEYQANANPIPTIVNMSLRFIPADDALDEFVDRLVDQGVHVVVSAGNQKRDACTQSPARAPRALAVGASTIKDEFWKGSNFGPKVAIFAPGAEITSAGIAGPAAHKLDSGTSMASPLVAGTIAWLIQQEGNRSPEDMLKRLQQLADASGRVVTGAPADTNTTTRLIWNGVQ